MANSNRTKIKPQIDGDNLSDDDESLQDHQRPSPLNGVRLPRPPKHHTFAETHGLITMKRTMLRLGGRALDGRYSVSKTLKKWRLNIIDDLGGKDTISAQQETLVELASRTKLLLDSVDAWLLTQPTLITGGKKSRALMPVVLQRGQLADSLAKYMSMLGLERRHKVQTLHEILSQQDTDDDKPANGNGEAKHEDKHGD